MPNNIFNENDGIFNKLFIVFGSIFSLFALLNLAGVIYIQLWTFQAIILLALFSLEYLPEIYLARRNIRKLSVTVIFYLLGALPMFYLFFEIPRLDWYYGTLWETGDIILGPC